MLKLLYCLNSYHYTFRIFWWLYFSHMNPTFSPQLIEERRMREGDRERREIRRRRRRERRRERGREREIENNLKELISLTTSHHGCMGWSDLEMTEWISYFLIHSQILRVYHMTWDSRIYRYLIFITWPFSMNIADILHILFYVDILKNYNLFLTAYNSYLTYWL